MSNNNDLERYKRFINAMLVSINAVAESCTQLQRPMPREVEVKKHYYGLAKKQLDSGNVEGCKAVLDEMRSFLEP